MKVEVPRGLFFTVMGIILVNQAIEEWNIYLKTKNKVYLVIPIASIVIIIFTVFNI